MREHVLIFGASGSGTSTFGRAIAKSHGLAIFDADDFFWEPTDPPFQHVRELSERQRLLTEALSGESRWVLSGSICGWGDVAIRLLDLAVFVMTPTPVRLERLRERERRLFGERISSIGDMHHHHEAFLAWAAQYDDGSIDTRSRRMHEEWMKQLNCPVVRVDGSSPIETVLNEIGTAICGD
jgi:adenylate kinase family enzyme